MRAPPSNNGNEYHDAARGRRKSQSGVGEVALPSLVSVRYLAEVTGQDLEKLSAVMRDLHILVDIDRSVDFGAARKVLEHFGIRARSNGTYFERS